MTGADLTEDTAPAGTTVIDGKGVKATVLAWREGSVKVEYANGGTAYSPGHHFTAAGPSFRVITARPAGRRRDGSPLPPRRFVLARPELEPFGDSRSRIFEAVWIPELCRFDHHPHVVLTDSIVDSTLCLCGQPTGHAPADSCVWVERPAVAS